MNSPKRKEEPWHHQKCKEQSAKESIQCKLRFQQSSQDLSASVPFPVADLHPAKQQRRTCKFNTRKIKLFMNSFHMKSLFSSFYLHKSLEHFSICACHPCIAARVKKNKTPKPWIGSCSLSEILQRLSFPWVNTCLQDVLYSKREADSVKFNGDICQLATRGSGLI